MDEPKKVTSVSTDSKESSSFDGDFGKNFLSSWKSAKTGKVQIDFDVESVPRNKKTAFNFDKLDDFELGGDFDKLSSFKMDMRDLDFSSPVKKSEKPKGKSCEEIVPGKKKVEQDKFSFSFNFNELDKFDLDPNLLKGEEKTKKSVADGGPDYSTKHGKDKESIMHDDNQESVIHDKSQPLKDRGHQDVSREAVTSSEKNMISVGEKEKATHSKGGEKQQSDGSSFLKRYSENARPNLSRLSVSSDSSAKEALPQIKSGLASLDFSKADPARELDDTARSIDRSQSQNSSPANSSNSGSWRRASTTESPNNTSTTESPNDTSDTRKVQGNPSQVTRGSTVPCESTKGRQDLDNACAANFSQHPKLLPSLLHRGSVLLKSVSLNEKSTTSLQLKPLSINESQPTSAPAPKQLNAVDSGKIRSMNVCPDYDNRESKQNTATEIGNQKTQDKSSSKDTSVITGSGKNDKSDPSLVQHPPSILPGQTTVTNNVKNILPNSFSATATKKSLQCISAERQGISLKDRKMYDIGSLKLSGVTKSNINTSNFTMQKETMAVRFLERKLEVPLNTVSKQSNCATAKKYALSSPSLKRKILEESKTDPESFNPLKRVMESTTQRRGSLEVSPTINKRLEVSPKVDSNLVLGTGNSEAYQGNVSMDTLDYSNRVPEMKNVVDLELPVLIENDGNVEKAEACAKELDDICNMLRKKNEEAKELLVRSVVNNNALMMLNHPMYDEKIRTLQKKFASLNSREF